MKTSLFKKLFICYKKKKSANICNKNEKVIKKTTFSPNFP